MNVSVVSLGITPVQQAVSHHRPFQREAHHYRCKGSRIHGVRGSQTATKFLVARILCTMTVCLESLSSDGTRTGMRVVLSLTGPESQVKHCIKNLDPIGICRRRAGNRWCCYKEVRVTLSTLRAGKSRTSPIVSTTAIVQRGIWCFRHSSCQRTLQRIESRCATAIDRCMYVEMVGNPFYTLA